MTLGAVVVKLAHPVHILVHAAHALGRMEDDQG